MYLSCCVPILTRYLGYLVQKVGVEAFSINNDKNWQGKVSKKMKKV